MTIIHGENLPQSRQKLWEILEQAKNQNRQIIRVEANSLNLAKLEEVLGTTDLFDQPKTIIFDGLHSLVKSKKKDELLKALSQAAQSLPETTELVLWESRALTKTMLKLFPQAQVLEFKISGSVFGWLDSLSPEPSTKPTQLKKFRQALANEDPYMCLAMLIRQVRLLIQAKDGGQLKGAPFMIAKLKKQASLFSLEKLIALTPNCWPLIRVKKLVQVN